MNIESTIRLSFASLILLLVTSASLAAPPGFSEEVVLSGRDQPTHLTALPDGRMLLLQKDGLVSIFDPSVQPATAQAYMLIPGVESDRERGLTSLALDPDFETNGYIYIYYTHAASARNRISRFTHGGNTADPASEIMLWQDNEDWQACCHYGGGFGFGPDGKLYLTTGEEFEGAQSPDLTRAGGKIIRINKDGSIPADNPFVDGPGGNLDEIWAYGLRNPFRAYWDLPTARFFITDVGGNVQATAREEINLGVAGANYGWPDCEGGSSESPANCNGVAGVERPIWDYSHTAATPAGGSISAGFVYRGSQYPAAYNELFFYGDYARSFIRTLSFNPDGSVAQDTEFHTNMGAPVHMIQGPDDAMYVVDYGTGGADGRVLRYTYAIGNQPPSISSVTATPEAGQAPLMVNFSVTASDPEMDAMTYRWVFGDGTPDSTEQNPTHTYNSTGPFYAFVEVNDGTRSVFSELQLVQVGNIPVVSILTPMDGDLFRAGDTISFSGAASDPDESIPASNYSWDIRFFHNAHTHPTLTNYIGTSGTLDIETSGHDWLEDTGFEFVLTVTDSDGLSSSDTIRIYPDKVDITVDTIPSGIPFFADGLSLDTPIVYDTLIGFEHEISALSSYCVNGENYVFDSWSNGEAQTHTYTVPDMDAALTATYVSSGACLPIPSAGLVFHVEAGAGVSLGGGSDVTAWADQSPQANNLSAGGAPQLVAGALNGEDYVSFDGNDDILQRVTGINGLPAANADRTVYSIVNYTSTGYGGVAYGTDAINEAFGLIVAPNGNLMIQGWGTSNDFDSGIAGSNMGWMVQSAVHQNGQLTHYQDGVQIDTRAHDYATTLSKIVLGAEIDGTPFMDMDVAGVFIYDRVLDAAEKQQLESYIDVKYFGGVRIDIFSPMEGQTVTSGDVPVMYGAAGATYDHIHLSLDGGADVEINDATGSHTFTSVGAGAHMVTATLVDAAHAAVGTANSQAMVNFMAEDCFPDDFAPNCTVDTDGDGTPDSVEGATADSDGDGTLDYLESSLTDADGDGTPDQMDSNDADACVPSTTGIGCPQPPPPPPQRRGGGSFSLAWLMALSGVLAIRRRRYHNKTGR